MTRPRTLVALLAGCALLAIALWRLTGPFGSAGRTISTTHAPESAPGTNAASLDGSEGEANPAARESGAGVGPAVAEALLPPLHVPDYGPDLQRPSARAVFELRDARGEPLEGDSLAAVELRRQVGGSFVAHAAALDPAASRVVCAGPGETGLPPGDYEIEVVAGPYGTVRESFTLVRDGLLQRTLTFPRWRRIVHLVLRDGAGRPLARITQAPEYAFEATKPSIDPAPFAALGGTVANPSALPFLAVSRRGWEAYYETDGGAYHVRVFAGLPARIKLDVERQRYGRDAIVLASDFSGPEWDAYEIVLEPVAGLDDAMATWVDVNPKDPGERSLLAAPILPPPAVEDPADESDRLPGRVRFVVQVDTPVAVRMLSEAGTTRRAADAVLERAGWPADELWFMDVMKDPHAPEEERDLLSARCWFTDDFLFLAEAPLLEITQETAGRSSVQFRVALAATPVVLDVVPPSPTIAAYARRVRLSIASAAESPGAQALRAGVPAWLAGNAGAEPAPERTIEVAKSDAGLLRIRTGIDADLARALLADARATVAFLGSEGEGEGFKIARALDDAERASLARGSLELAGGGAGLALRIVDADAVGAPEVHAALVPLAQAARAEETMRACLAPPDGDAERPSLEQCAHRIGVQGVLVSDRDGYALDDRLRLAAGERYALWLFWMRGETLAAARVDFRATAGITDLGVVRLPAR